VEDQVKATIYKLLEEAWTAMRRADEQLSNALEETEWDNPHLVAVEGQMALTSAMIERVRRLFKTMA